MNTETVQTIVPIKDITEYALPAAAQTHEVLVINPNLLVISQQPDGSLLKVSLDDYGRPTEAFKFTITTRFSGLHGLCRRSDSCSGIVTIWATLQFDNQILEIDPVADDISASPIIRKTIDIPSPAYGPHSVLENDGYLWITCKDSSHIVKLKIDNSMMNTVYSVSRRPIFIAVHPTSKAVYASLDLSSKIWCLGTDGAIKEIPVPPTQGNTPVGLLAEPEHPGREGNAWVVLLGGPTTATGTFGRINSDSSITWFSLTSDLGKTAGLIHMAFNPQDASQFWLLSSSISNPAAVNAVFTAKVDDSAVSPKIEVQNTIMLPTQRSAAHRVILHRAGLYVTELTASTLAHIKGGAVSGLQVSETSDRYADFGQGFNAAVVIYANDN